MSACFGDSFLRRAAEYFRYSTMTMMQLRTERIPLTTAIKTTRNHGSSTMFRLMALGNWSGASKTISTSVWFRLQSHWKKKQLNNTISVQHYPHYQDSKLRKVRHFGERSGEMICATRLHIDQQTYSVVSHSDDTYTAYTRHVALQTKSNAPNKLPFFFFF